MHEPHATALVLVSLGLLMSVSALFSRASGRFGVPVALLFLALGILAGSEGLGHIPFEDYGFAFRLGTVALVLILFDGGLNTPWGAVREGLGPAVVLATLGVAGTAGVVALGAHFFFGMGWPHALLVGAVVSSTDAAAVFSVLRGSGIHLQRRVGVTLELESGLNDPMAVILTLAMTEAIATGHRPGWSLLLEVPLQLAVGGACGVALGYAWRLLLNRVRLTAVGLYPVVTLGLAFLAFGLATLLHGSGFLAVYVAAVVVGNGLLPHRTGLLRVHDALAWFSQVVMFLVLGLLVLPSRLITVGWEGLGLGLLLAFVARPLVVALCLAPFRYPLREAAYVGWVGLRGAVPIILATFPVLVGVPDAAYVFNVVFFVVVVNALVPGGTVRHVTRWLRLESNTPPAPQAVLEISSMQQLNGDMASFFIGPASAVAHNAVMDVPFPPGSNLMLIVRGRELVAPRGDTQLLPGDHVYVFYRHEDEGLVKLLFGGLEEG
ncbi:potassium/proton antiporter [Aggregicoccus sp. 17bor-14]|uniref:potassium/proton antiporter n=1 Tax=Myxococcaceae TaxID=31 RepID=UPI00129C2041|nr:MULTISPECIES: potassium/proton antiporter [Myxococcaceae]MBF5045348.1 potassium/proton antiporter [Simulacricoccus sp. 17bor-14]MRI91090.1 potassium/proton antiporter [Aggregicoccus sp. 17bor-14]